MLAAACGVLGLIIGSFVNVVVHRLPRQESLVRPRSRCPACATTIAARDNIPLVSWVLLRGRCRTCGSRISARYPAIEALTAGLFAAAAARFGPSAALPAFLVLFAAIIAIAAIDLEHKKVPNRIVYPAFAAGAVLLAIAAVLGPALDPLVRAAVGAAGAFGAFYLIHSISPRGMGFGDVRLSALLGLYLGWLGLAHLYLGIMLGFVLGSVVGVALMGLGRAGRKTKIPFAPFLAAGAVLAILAGEPLLDAYENLLSPGVLWFFAFK